MSFNLETTKGVSKLFDYLDFSELVGKNLNFFNNLECASKIPFLHLKKCLHLKLIKTANLHFEFISIALIISCLMLFRLYNFYNVKTYAIPPALKSF